MDQNKLTKEIADRVLAVRCYFKPNNASAFARELELAQPTYAKYETGERKLSPEFVNDLADKYNVNLTWLFTGKGEMFNDPIEASFEECDDIEISKNFKDLYKRYTKMLADLNITDYEVSKKTGISETRLEKIGLGDTDITMEEFIKLRSKYAFDANMFLYNKGVYANNAESDNKLSAEELAVLKKLAQKIK